MKLFFFVKENTSLTINQTSFKTMSIQSLMILNAEGVFSAEYIANQFLIQNIAQVSNIIFIPCIKNNTIYQMIYIEILNWCDSEIAYNFISRLKLPEGEARINYNINDDWWVVQSNTHYNGQIDINKYGITFSQQSFINQNEPLKENEEAFGEAFGTSFDEACEEILKEKEKELIKEYSYDNNIIMDSQFIPDIYLTYEHLCY